MKNYLIVFLLLVIIVLGSLLYKYYYSNIFHYFPLEKTSSIEVPLYLYFFFSRQNCRDCLSVIEFLNETPEQFEVIGVVPDDELLDEARLRRETMAAFKLVGVSKFKRVIPLYAPTMMGISKKGKIYFVLPGVPNTKEYLEKFLSAFYIKAYRHLM
jgi:hypothetical protein